MRFSRKKYPYSIDFFRASCYTERDKERAMERIELKESEVLEDMQLDGLKIVQDKNLYRFTSDSVLLSKFAKAKNGDNVADFCAGSGIVAFHFYALNRHEKARLQFTLFELQESLLSLAKKTAVYNGFDNFSFACGRLQEIEEKYREKFSLVLCNPPYEKGGFDNETYEKAICRKEITLTLEEIAQSASFALKYGGRIAMLHRADRLAEVCYTLKSVHIEIKKIQFVAGRDGAKPYLVMVEGVKGGKPACDILPTIVNKR
ncbi:MAG: methyltransferase domain-containing protein [Clostridiales bacterium]|nr:methyltransferase domain-containing protein [Clostridiales bacterium]